MKFEFSAGGIVYKREKILNYPKGTSPAKRSGAVQDDIYILVCQHSQHHGWVFPKGFIGDKIAGESKEDTALREVEEETGIKGEIIEPVKPITYWYKMDGIKREKTVYYYIMCEIGGDITKHDWEMENVEWLPIEKVEERLTYDSDKEVWKEARKRIKEITTNY
jgi:8-oxo-dGTP pyrophosphatase MutT (NUDIX family)